MKQIMKLLFFIKITIFIHLTWIYHINKYMRTSNPYLDKCNPGRDFDTRTCRLLGVYKQQIYSDVVWLKGDAPTVEEYKKLCGYNFRKVTREKTKHQKVLSVNNTESFEQARERQSPENNRKNSYFDKRLINKIYYINKDSSAKDKYLKLLGKNIKKKKKVLYVFSVPFVAFALAIIALRKLDHLNFKDYVFFSLDSFHPLVIVFAILGIIVITAIIYASTKIEKYDKLGHIKSRLNYTKYSPFIKLNSFTNNYRKFPVKCGQ
ncbi:hypothetical protein MKS88_002593 [Plasmodium brasilianum]|uniref:Uncharacterized protein n=1 Tax=Plasmodium brasilianum TaxID=5824 RepID=A0ACB9YB29_PLABR|nr:hypothetical protein MKS88_002593 [Plasmodium brasilianum]